jgi:hypothetical protein
MTENLNKSPRGRVKRTPIAGRNRLSVHNKDDNYVYRIVNDVDDRIDAFKENGWEPVLAKDTKIGDKRVEGSGPTGSVAEISVGGGTKAVVMRIKREWYEEDQAAKAKHVDAIEQTMKEDAQRGNYGKIDLTRD